MAERRMFAKTIIDSDMFLDMPLSAQALYFHLCMRADDDGFINNAMRILRTVGCSNDDYRLLLAKQFLVPFDNGVVVIKHWRIHNYIRNDRYKETLYLDEKNKLTLGEDKSYQRKEESLFEDTENFGIPNGYQMETQVRLVKDSIGKDRLVYMSSDKNDPPTPSFVPPTIKEITEYAQMIGCKLDAEYFFDTYTSQGWMVNGNPITDWKALVRKWKKNPKNYQHSSSETKRADYTGSWDNVEGDTF